MVELNNNLLVLWYFGTDGKPGRYQRDFVTVAMHEIAHGLGFFSNARVENGQGKLRDDDDRYPTIFDHFVENGSEISILSFDDPSTALLLQFRSNNLFWNGQKGEDANGDSRPKLYAPATWEKGSSYAHLNEATFPKGDSNSLMTPITEDGEAMHYPGDITLGMLEDMGWTLNKAPMFTEGDIATRTVVENTPAGVDIGAPISATDSTDDPLTYTLSGTDAVSFDIVSSSGQLRTKAPLDYETENTYTVTITVRDDTLPNVSDGNTIIPFTDTIDVTISVTNVSAIIDARTPQVREAIVAAVPGVSLEEDVNAAAQLAAITELDLSSENINTLQTGDFDGLTALTSLALTHNSLETLPAGIFDGLTALTELGLGYNSLETLPADIFDELTGLTELDLYSNDLETLPVGIFDGLTALTELDLFNNDLTTLRADVFEDLTALTELQLSFNAFTALPAGIFDGLTALTTLDVYSSGLTTLPAGIFDGLTALTELDLSFNGLTTLPAGIFDGLTALTTLHLSLNTVDPLPLTVSLEKVAEGQFKAVTTTGAPFTFVLPVSISNGSITGGATTLTIPKGSIESDSLTVTRTPGTTAAVTANIGNTLQGLPSGHSGYELVKSADLPVEVISGDDTTTVSGAPTFTEGFSTTRTVLENTQSGVDIGDPVSATDPDNDPLSYTLSGRNAASFDIVSSSGQLQTDASLNYETKNTYTVIITASDGNLTDTITVTINVIDVEEGTFTAVSERTPEVRDRIIFEAGVSSAEDVTAVHLASITRLYLSYQNITALQVGDFDGLTALTTLLLSGNDFTTLPKDIFDGLTQLTELDLYNNALTTLPDGIFDGLTQLTELDLRSNALETLPAGIFDGLTNLTTLNMQRNALETLPAGIFDDLTALPELDLRYNALETLPASIFDGLTALTDLLLYQNNLETLPGGIFDELTNLTELDLSSNALTTLPASIFDELTNLTRLALYSNALERLPGGIFDDLTNLTTLNLADNALTTLPGGIFDELTNLTTLSLAVNHFTTLPAKIFDGLTALTDLLLYQNNLETLPGGIFDELTNLTELELYFNAFTTLPGGIFDQLTNLTELHLHFNAFTTLPAGIFDGLTNLTKLSLDENTVDPLSLTVSLEKVAEGQFKAVAPTGAPFAFVLPVSVSNGSITGGATTLTIPAGSLESDTFTVTRTPGTTDAVTANIGDALPGLPSDHRGYEIVKSTALPVEVISSGNTLTNRAPTFTEGIRTTRTIEEHTQSGVNIGDPVSATDPNNDTLTYSLSGTDAASFEIVSTSGQLQTKAALDYETKNTYRVTITVSDGSRTDTITVTINITDIDENAFTPLSERTSQVSSAIVAAAGVNSADDVTAAHLETITSLNLSSRNITTLQTGDFDRLAALTELNLSGNDLATLPDDIFDGLTALTTLNLSGNGLTALPADIFDGLTALTTLSLSGNGLTALPADIFDELTQLKELNLSRNELTTLPTETFDGLTQLKELFLFNNALTTLPEGIFDDLTALTWLWLSGNTVDPLPLIVSLEKVAEGEFKAVAPTGAPFALVLPVSVSNGSIARGRASLTIPRGSVESNTLTVTRASGTTDAVTIDIGSLPDLPTDTNASGLPLHRGYELVKSTDLPLEVISAIPNRAPVFTESSSASRTVAENTQSGVDIGDPVSATDPDNDTLTYTLSGTDAASFDIVSSSGQLRTDASLDYETKDTYTVIITVSDENLTDTITVDINVTDVSSIFSERTSQVRDAIVAAVPGVSSEDEVTTPHLSVIRELDLSNQSITTFASR